jgi:hypothetical protein
MVRRKKGLAQPGWLPLKELMNSAEIQALGVTELDVVRWKREEKISYRIIEGKKSYDIAEVVGFALAMSNGWLLGEEEE